MRRISAAVERTHHRRGPKIIAPDPWAVTEGVPEHLTTEEDESLASIATVVRYRKNEMIYQVGENAGYVFFVISGGVKTILKDHKNFISYLLFPGDFFGLSQGGRYFTTSVAISPTSLYRVPAHAFRRLLKDNPQLDYKIFCSLHYMLREALQHAFILSRPSVIERLALFIQMLGIRQTTAGNNRREVYLPMTREDIALFLGLSAAAVSRGLTALSDRGAIVLRDRRHVRIVDHALLQAAISGNVGVPTRG